VTPTIDRRAEVSTTVEYLRTLAANRPGPRPPRPSPAEDRAPEQNEPIATGTANARARTETPVKSTLTPEPQFKDERQSPPILRNEPTEPVRAPGRSERILRAEKASIAPAPHRGKNQPKAWNNSRHARRARRALERTNGLREVEKGLDLAGLKGKNLLIPVELS